MKKHVNVHMTRELSAAVDMLTKKRILGFSSRAEVLRAAFRKELPKLVENIQLCAVLVSGHPKPASDGQLKTSHL